MNLNDLEWSKLARKEPMVYEPLYHNGAVAT